MNLVNEILNEINHRRHRLSEECLRFTYFSFNHNLSQININKAQKTDILLVNPLSHAFNRPEDAFPTFFAFTCLEMKK